MMRDLADLWNEGRSSALRERFAGWMRRDRSGAREDETDKDIPTPRLGLALSAGGARGLAHIGVLEVLEENGIEVDLYAGSSMGAYIAALAACGASTSDMVEVAAAFRTKKDFRKLVDPAFPPVRGFMRGRKIRAHLEETLCGVRFEDLTTKLLIVAAELYTFRKKVFCDEGDVAAAVHASIAIPGIFYPVEIEGVEYIDGGVATPLPVNVLKDEGADVVIAVNVGTTVEALADRRAATEEERRSRSPLRRGFDRINRAINPFAKDNVIDIINSVSSGPRMRVADDRMEAADIAIVPKVGGGPWDEYHRFEEYIESGRQATREKLPEILAALAPNDDAASAGELVSAGK